jgi:hypothetical protein
MGMSVVRVDEGSLHTACYAVIVTFVSINLSRVTDMHMIVAHMEVSARI